MLRRLFRKRAARKADEARISPSMTESEIRDAGLAIDVPFETPPVAKGPIRYSNGRTLDDDAPWLQDLPEPARRWREARLARQAKQAKEGDVEGGASSGTEASGSRGAHDA